MWDLNLRPPHSGASTLMNTWVQVVAYLVRRNKWNRVFVIGRVSANYKLDVGPHRWIMLCSAAAAGALPMRHRKQ